MKPSRLCIAAHGGAGRQAMTASQRTCLAEALVTGFQLLKQGGPAIEAVEMTIRVMEASGLFNAGVGSRLQLDGIRRMDASIMEGQTLRAGAVAAVEGIRHPITAARLVMQKTDHVLLMGPPATQFARYFNLEPHSSAKRTRVERIRRAEATDRSNKSWHLYQSMREKSRLGLETVGAVARDERGTVAAGASTGGIPFMLPGRVGDTPLIGCGVYADNQAGAISMTGIGEGIIRIGVAKEIADRLTDGAGPSAAARAVLRKLVARIKGQAGALVLTADGRLAIRHTTPHMAAGSWSGAGQPVIADQF